MICHAIYKDYEVINPRIIGPYERSAQTSMLPKGEHMVSVYWDNILQ